MFKKMKFIVPVLAVIVIIAGISHLAEAKRSRSIDGVVNINTASADELTMLPGVGPSKARAIVTHREAEKFETVDDLMKVKGIGQKLFEKIEAYIAVDGPTTAKLVNAPSIELDTPTDGSES